MGRFSSSEIIEVIELIVLKFENIFKLHLRISEHTALLSVAAKALLVSASVHPFVLFCCNVGEIRAKKCANLPTFQSAWF